MKVTVRKKKGRPSCQAVAVTPLEGIRWAGGALRFGDTFEQVRAVLGEPEDADHIFYQGSDIAVRFDKEGRVECIEFLGGADSTLQPKLFGIYPLRADADTVYQLLHGQNGDDIDASQAEYRYAFCTLGISLYRDSTPQDVENLIQEVRDSGREPNTDEDVALERWQASHWSALGVGKPGYYQK